MILAALGEVPAAAVALMKEYLAATMAEDS